MSTLYETIISLCQTHGIKGGKMCTDLGISKSLLTDLKMGRKKGLNAETAQKIASYFGVTVGYLLGEEQKETPSPKEEREVDDDDIKFALWGTREIDDEVLDQVKAFAKFARENRKDK
jgi:transcriptional regulator with XRE-family HTH domain